MEEEKAQSVGELIEKYENLTHILLKIKILMSTFKKLKNIKIFDKINEELKLNISQQPLNILFWGSTNSGKSTLINSLIDNIPVKTPSRGILPISAVSETSNLYFFKLTPSKIYEINFDDYFGIFTREDCKKFLANFSKIQKDIRKENNLNFSESTIVNAEVKLKIYRKN